MTIGKLWSAILALALLAGLSPAQEPQQWTGWNKLTNPDSDHLTEGITWRWRKIATGGKVNVPLEIEVRNTNASQASGAAPKTRWKLTVLYERAIEGASYQRNAPTRELCYLTCTAPDDPAGSRCVWTGADGAVGTRVMEARVTHE